MHETALALPVLPAAPVMPPERNPAAVPAAGARDAACFAPMFGSGLRRSEAVSVRLADYDGETGALRIIGKGDKRRMAYAPYGGRAAIGAWLAVRGEAAGPILCPVDRSEAAKRAAAGRVHVPFVAPRETRPWGPIWGRDGIGRPARPHIGPHGPENGRGGAFP